MRVFPHRDWPPDSGSAPRRRVRRAHLSLEGLETRALLAVTASALGSPDFPLLGMLAGGADVARFGVPSPPPTSPPPEGEASAPPPPPAAPSALADPSGPASSSTPSRWVIDGVQWQPVRLMSYTPASSPASVEEIAAIHDTLLNAQILPEADDLQVQGTTVAGSPADMYRLPIDARMGSITVSLMNPGAAAHLVKHIQLLDDAGNLYGDLKLEDPSSTLSISIHPRIPRSEQTLYLGIFSTPSPSYGGTSPDPYALSVIQQPDNATNVTANTVTQSGQGADTTVFASLSVGVAVPSLTWDFSSAANQAAPLATIETSDSLELEPVVSQKGSALALPQRVVAPEGGILSMGDGTDAFVPSAREVDLALIDFDAIVDESVDPEAEGYEVWALDLSRPSEGLPLAMTPLEEYTPDAKLAALDREPAVALDFEAPRVDHQVDEPGRKSRRWGLLQTGVGIASAVAFALLMPDAALMLHDPKFRPRRRPQRPASEQ